MAEETEAGIVAEYALQEPDGRMVLQTWFVECKHHNKSNPVGVADLQPKVAWADAEEPDYLLIITSSRLSSDAKDWIDRVRRSKRYKLRYWEDSTLSDLVMRFPTLSEVYLQSRVALTTIDAQRMDHQIQMLRNELSASDHIVLDEVLGNPPDRLLFTFHCPAITGFTGAEPTIGSDHRVLLALGDPLKNLPTVRVLTPIFHPHVYFNGLMCYGYCDPLISLSVFIRHVYSVISGQAISLRSAVLSDQRVLDYYRSNFREPNEGA